MLSTVTSPLFALCALLATPTLIASATPIGISGAANLDPRQVDTQLERRKDGYFATVVPGNGIKMRRGHVPAARMAGASTANGLSAFEDMPFTVWTGKQTAHVSFAASLDLGPMSACL